MSKHSMRSWLNSSGVSITKSSASTRARVRACWEPSSDSRRANCKSAFVWHISSQVRRCSRGWCTALIFTPLCSDKADSKADDTAGKKASAATIKGESVSSVGLDTFADASKTATKSKVVSTKYLVGPKYEQLQIQMKGVAVQVIRPAANPAPDGPAMSSPKARSGEVSKLESGYYDADADVVVVVTAGGKAGAQKVLGTILKH